MLGLDCGLNEDIDLPADLFDLDELVHFFMKVFNSLQTLSCGEAFVFWYSWRGPLQELFG
jgi:hypothetical protein